MMNRRFAGGALALALAQVGCSPPASAVGCYDLDAEPWPAAVAAQLAQLEGAAPALPATLRLDSVPHTSNFNRQYVGFEAVIDGSRPSGYSWTRRDDGQVMVVPDRCFTCFRLQFVPTSDGLTGHAEYALEYRGAPDVGPFPVPIEGRRVSCEGG